eukprot:2988130-Prorocentrum_lima.AAC.1
MQSILPRRLNGRAFDLYMVIEKDVVRPLAEHSQQQRGNKRTSMAALMKSSGGKMWQYEIEE